eukprot:jgi/Hompol1/34/HPOL_000828-RA
MSEATDDVQGQLATSACDSSNQEHILTSVEEADEPVAATEIATETALATVLATATATAAAADSLDPAAGQEGPSKDAEQCSADAIGLDCASADTIAERSAQPGDASMAGIASSGSSSLPHLHHKNNISLAQLGEMVADFHCSDSDGAQAQAQTAAEGQSSTHAAHAAVMEPPVASLLLQPIGRLNGAAQHQDGRRRPSDLGSVSSSTSPHSPLGSTTSTLRIDDDYSHDYGRDGDGDDIDDSDIESLGDIVEAYMASQGDLLRELDALEEVCQHMLRGNSGSNHDAAHTDNYAAPDSGKYTTADRSSRHSRGGISAHEADAEHLAQIDAFVQWCDSFAKLRNASKASLALNGSSARLPTIAEAAESNASLASLTSLARRATAKSTASRRSRSRRVQVSQSSSLDGDTLKHSDAAALSGGNNDDDSDSDSDADSFASDELTADQAAAQLAAAQLAPATPALDAAAIARLLRDDPLYGAAPAPASGARNFWPSPQPSKKRGVKAALMRLLSFKGAAAAQKPAVSPQPHHQPLSLSIGVYGSVPRRPSAAASATDDPISGSHSPRSASPVGTTRSMSPTLSNHSTAADAMLFAPRSASLQ